MKHVKHLLTLLSIAVIASPMAHAAEEAIKDTAKDTVAAEAPPTATPTATTVPARSLSIEDVYSYATAPGQSAGAVFFSITNKSATADKVTGATTEVAEKATLHTNMIEQDTVTMINVGSYDIPANGTLKLESNGHHIMLMGLTKPLTEGMVFPLQIMFEKSAPITVDVTVRAPGSQPAEDHSAHGGHAHEDTDSSSSATIDTSEVPAHHEEPAQQ